MEKFRLEKLSFWRNYISIILGAYKPIMLKKMKNSASGEKVQNTFSFERSSYTILSTTSSKMELFLEEQQYCTRMYEGQKMKKNPMFGSQMFFVGNSSIFLYCMHGSTWTSTNSIVGSFPCVISI